MLQVHGMEGISWPPTSAFSFCCWFRIDSSRAASEGAGTKLTDTNSGTKLTAAKPCALLFSLRPQGGGEQDAIRAHLTNGLLTVQSPGRFVTTLSAQSFEFGCLYHVGIVYERQRTLLGPDTLTLFVDGREVEEQKITFDKNIKDLKTSTGMIKQRFDLLLAGDAVTAGQGGGGGLSAAAVMRLGHACLLDDALPAKYMHALFLVGSEAICQVGSELGGMIPSDVVRHPLWPPSDKPLLSRPAAFLGKQLLNESGKLALSGVRLTCSASSVCCYRQVLPFSAAVEPDNAIAQLVSRAFTTDSAGNCQVLLHRSVQSVHPLPFAQALRTVGGADSLLQLISSAQTTATLNRSLCLLVSCVRLKAQNLEKLSRSDGYALLALKLQSKAHLMDAMSLHAIFDLVGINSSNASLGALCNDEALRDVVLCNPLWELVAPKLASEAYKMLSRALSVRVCVCEYVPLPRTARLCMHGCLTLLDSAPKSRNAGDCWPLPQLLVTVGDCSRQQGELAARLVQLGAMWTWLQHLLSLPGQAPPCRHVSVACNNSVFSKHVCCLFWHMLDALCLHARCVTQSRPAPTLLPRPSRDNALCRNASLSARLGALF